MDYEAIISLTEDENTVFSEVAADAGKTPQQIVTDLAAQLIGGQIRQWIKDKCETEISKQEPASSYLRLKGQKS